MQDLVQGDQELVWEGTITSGGPPHVFKGTAESIYREIVQLNPSYDASKFEQEDTMKMKHRLAKRDNVSDTNDQSSS